MNKTEQAQQLRLAAELIKTGHPFQFQDAGEWIRAITVTPDHAICERRKIRPILATPPDNRPLHNPDKLTAEQVGVGYRLALIDEKTNENEALQEFWNKGEWMTSGRVYSDTFGEAPNHRTTYRLPLTVPWPEVKADPYAELKAAKKAGKAIEAQMPNGEWFDYNPGDPQWNLQPECYRIKPEPPAFQLPPPPIGMKWHREDGWKEGDLPQGYRPLVYNERRKNEDEWAYDDVWRLVANYGPEGEVGKSAAKHRTTRPLIFTHEDKEWTWHRPGDPMPCNGHAKVTVLYNDPVQEYTGTPCHADCFNWKNSNGFTPIIGWRYAETTNKVELGPQYVIAKLKEAIAMLETLANTKA